MPGNQTLRACLIFGEVGLVAASFVTGTRSGRQIPRADQDKSLNAQRIHHQIGDHKSVWQKNA